jgi:hypothetical protein
MADHLDQAGLKSPDMDARIDITDIYAFQKPGDPSKSILILNVNPLAPTLATSFDPDAVYELKVDTTGDSVADIAFRIRFSDPDDNGMQTATVRHNIGQEAATEGNHGALIIDRAPVSFDRVARVTTNGPYKFYAGLRSDPFFFDLKGFLAGFKFTGSDFFKDKNVFGIALEIPNTALGPKPKVGIWARVVHHVSGKWIQVDRMGRPAINTVFNHGADKKTFNGQPPTMDRATFLPSFVSTLRSFGHSDTEAQALARILLPDILTYDYSSAKGFLNGRKLTDDVIDAELTLVTKGKLTTDKVGPHTDYLADFPYLGNPH